MHLKDQNNSTVGKVLVLHTDNPGSFPGVIPEHSDPKLTPPRNKPEALPDMD